MRKRSNSIDMCSGPLFWDILRFFIPFVLTGFLQRLYHAADVLVVGRYAGEAAIAGVGTTGSLSTMIIDMAVGLSVGVSVALGRAILRAKGDSKRPMYIITVSGILNVLLNLFFVLVCKMEAAGVAFATVISQVYNAVAIVYLLRREEGPLKLNFKKIKVYGNQFMDILRVGVPTGLQGMVFSFSNVIIQTSVMALAQRLLLVTRQHKMLVDFSIIVLIALHKLLLFLSVRTWEQRTIKEWEKLFVIASLM